MKRLIAFLLCVLVTSASYAQIFPNPGGMSSHLASGAPTVRSVGSCAGNTGAATIAGLPAGVTAGDLLIFIIETANQAITPSWSGWTQVAASPPGTGTAGSTTATRLSVYYGISNGTETGTVNDSGDHQFGCIIAITAGTFNAGSPIDATDSTTQSATTSISVPGTVATAHANDLVLAITAGAGPDALADPATEFSAWANANLTGIVEIVDETSGAGNGGALGVASGSYAGPGAYGSTTATAVNSVVRANVSVAVKGV